eukprot:3269683-Alexandrium_andersonii.AAC.1
MGRFRACLHHEYETCRIPFAQNPEEANAPKLFETRDKGNRAFGNEDKNDGGPRLNEGRGLIGVSLSEK